MAMRAWVLRAEARINQLEAWRKSQPDVAALLRRIEALEEKPAEPVVEGEPVKRGPGRPKKEKAE